MRQHNQNDLQQALEDSSYFLTEIATMTQTGGYSCNLLTGAAFLDDMTRDLLSVPFDFKLCLNNILRFFVDKSSIKHVFKQSILGKESILDIEMVKFDGTQFWARLNCKPFQDNGRTIGLRGVVTSVDRYVKNAIKAEKDASVIKAQNERLVHFAHIVSHNLRSHASNFQLTLQTFDDVKEPNEIIVFNSYLNDISLSLNQTLKHLNEVVTINTSLQIKENIDIEAVFNLVLKEFQSEIDQLNAVVVYDFAELMSIEYAPTFLESIFRNLVSNTIKYRDPSRILKISVKTKFRNKRSLLVVKDNGLGIDLKKHGNKLFHMYRTFHNNDDARGVGLFLVKSKVEALGGDISVKSELGKGSSFSIRFN